MTALLLPRLSLALSACVRLKVSVIASQYV